MSLQNPFEKSIQKANFFSINRYGFDRSVWTCYYPSVVKNADNNSFDIKRLERINLENNLSPSIFNHRKESVLRFEQEDFLRYEMRLKSTRSMTFRFNFNRYFNWKYNLKHGVKCPVIHDDNFIPVDSNLGLNDFCDKYLDIQNFFVNVYKSLYSEIFPDDFGIFENEEPTIKCTTLEVYHELSPVNLTDIRDRLLVDKKSFKSYNSQSKTMYFGEKPLKDDGFEEIKDGVANLVTSDIHSWSKRKGKEIFQAKLYQKSITLARFERTIYAEDTQEEFTPDEVMWLIHDAYEKLDLVINPKHELTTDEVIILFSELLKLDNVLVSMLLNEGIYWEANKKNHVITQKLKRRGILEKSQRGVWVKTEKFKALIRSYIVPRELAKLKDIPKME